MARASGHVRLVERKRAAVWYLRYRYPSGKQVQRLLGPAWQKRSEPPRGYFNQKTAQAALDAILTDIRRGEIPDPGDSSGKTFADAVAEWLRYSEDDRGLEETTLADYRRTGRALIEEFCADTPLDDIDEDRVDDYRTRMLAGKVLTRRGGGDPAEDDEETHKAISRRTAQKRLVLLGGIFKRAKKVRWVSQDPTLNVDPVTLKTSGDFNVLTVQQVELVAGHCTELFAAAVIVAAYTGLRAGEMRALRWRDIDFLDETIHVRSNKPAGGSEKAPKSSKVRSVPLMEDAARVLDALSRRERFTAEVDRVFATETGGMLDQDAFRDALYAAMAAAGIDRKSFRAHGGFTFHDLRHTFGTLAMKVFPLSDVQAYMGHSNVQTTMRYIHHVPKVDAARRFTRAIERERSSETEDVSRTVSRTARNDVESNGISGQDKSAKSLQMANSA